MHIDTLSQKIKEKGEGREGGREGGKKKIHNLSKSLLGRLRSRSNNSRVPICKITRAKWTGPAAQVVECLLCNHKDLISNPNHTKNK
jgi:hypothetical protein